MRGSKRTIIRARRGWNLLRARAGGGSVILLYHRVARPSNDPFGLCVSPNHFADHMEIVARLARPAALPSLAPRRKGEARRSVAVTFDDAYEDVLTEALPVLERLGIPATVFAVSDVLGESFWWDRMAGIPVAVALGHLRAIGSLTVDPGWDPKVILGRLHTHLLSMPPEERDQGIQRLLAGTSTGPLPPRTLTSEELRALSASGTVEIGGHTRTHPNLAGLGEIEQEAEIREGRQVLEEKLGAPVTSFAYPFGTFAHFDRTTLRAVERSGFARACTAEPGVVTARTNPFGLPRLWVEDWGADEFRRRLSAWLR